MTPHPRAPESWPTTGFTRHIGIEALELHEDGSVEATIEVDEDAHFNAGGVVHGGVYTTLLDVVMGSCVVRTLGDDEWCATTQLNTEFQRPARGPVRGVGRVDRRGKLTAFCSGEVLDEEDRVVARATGVWAIRRG